jgi:hypothetical protein
LRWRALDKKDELPPRAHGPGDHARCLVEAVGLPPTRTGPGSPAPTVPQTYPCLPCTHAAGDIGDPCRTDVSSLPPDTWAGGSHCHGVIRSRSPPLHACAGRRASNSACPPSPRLPDTHGPGWIERPLPGGSVLPPLHTWADVSAAFPPQQQGLACRAQVGPGLGEDLHARLHLRLPCTRGPALRGQEWSDASALPPLHPWACGLLTEVTSPLSLALCPQGPVLSAASSYCQGSLAVPIDTGPGQGVPPRDWADRCLPRTRVPGLRRRLRPRPPPLCTGADARPRLGGRPISPASPVHTSPGAKGKAIPVRPECELHARRPGADLKASPTLRPVQSRAQADCPLLWRGRVRWLKSAHRMQSGLQPDHPLLLARPSFFPTRPAPLPEEL